MENILFGVQQEEINKKFPIFKSFGNVKEKKIFKKYQPSRQNI